MKKTKPIVGQHRQGDVLVERIATIPSTAKRIGVEEDGSVTLAHGEVTGHRHAFYGGAVMFRDDGSGASYVEITKPTALKHDEHTASPEKPGAIRVIRQREYSPEKIRPVAD